MISESKRRRKAVVDDCKNCFRSPARDWTQSSCHIPNIVPVTTSHCTVCVVLLLVCSMYCCIVLLSDHGWLSDQARAQSRIQYNEMLFIQIFVYWPRINISMITMCKCSIFCRDALDLDLATRRGEQDVGILAEGAVWLLCRARNMWVDSIS